MDTNFLFNGLSIIFSEKALAVYGALVSVILGYWLRASKQAKSDQLSVDRQLYGELHSILPPDSASLEMLAHQDFYDTFAHDNLKPLRESVAWMGRFDKTFFNNKLEARKAALHQSLSDFISAIELISTPVNSTVSTCLPDDESHDFADYSAETVERLTNVENLARVSFKRYTELVESAKAQLRV